MENQRSSVSPCCKTFSEVSQHEDLTACARPGNAKPPGDQGEKRNLEKRDVVHPV